MSTIYDVAKLAEVSAMTVSRVLNNPERVSRKARERTEAAIEQLGYKRNQAARALVAKSSGLVKIFLSDRWAVQDPYHMTLFAGISNVLSENEIAQLVVHDMAEHLKCDGMIITGLTSERASQLKIADYPAPVVSFGKSSDQVDWVDVDNVQGTYQATKHLLSLGHRDIAFFGFQTNETYIAEREAGFRQAMTEFGMHIKDAWMVTVSKNATVEAKNEALRVLKTTDVTGIVCASDIVGLGVTQAAKESNIAVPQDLSVVGFDGVGADMMSDPRLTTMKQPVFELGQRLAQILVDRINRHETKYDLVQETFPTELIVRGSTAKR
jgi:DNA-binding LacI/PurR family transcriptional regulator